MADLVERLHDYCREFGLGKSHVAWKCADEIERLQSLLEAANAYGAGENKARIEECEQLAQMMIRQSLSTGHGDTVADLVRELEPQIERLRADAERYRWLEERPTATGLARWMGRHQFLSTAIDAARKESE